MPKQLLYRGKQLLWLVLLWHWAGGAAAQTWDWATATTRVSFGTVRTAQTVADAQGNVYVTGYFQDVVRFGAQQLTASQPSSGYQANPDLFVAKLTPTGQWAWAVQAGGGSNGMAKGIGLAVAPNGQDVYVTGLAAGPVNFGSLVLPGSSGANNGFVARLSSSGQWQWVVRAGNCGSPVLDGTGKIYVAGSFAGSTLTFGPDTLVAPANNSNIFVAWLDASGQWLGAVSGGGTAFEDATSLAVDSHGNAYVGGTFSTFGGTTTQFGTVGLTPLYSGTSDNFVAKLDSLQHWQWAVRGGPFNVNNVTTEPAKVAVAPDGRTLLWGGTTTDATFGPFTVSRARNQASGAVAACLHRGGSWQWVATSTSTSTGTGTARLIDVACDNQGNWYTAGVFDGRNSFGQLPLSGGSTSAWVARASSTGTWQWVAGAGGLGNSLVTSLAAVGTHAYLGGYYSQSPSFGPFQLTTLNTFGSEGFVAQVGGAVLATRSSAAGLAATLHPNPAPGGRFTLTMPTQLTQLQVAEVTILNALGKQVYGASPLALAADGGLQATIDASALPAGLYVVCVRSAAGVVASCRLVVE